MGLKTLQIAEPWAMSISVKGSVLEQNMESQCHTFWCFVLCFSIIVPFEISFIINHSKSTGQAPGEKKNSTPERNDAYWPASRLMFRYISYIQAYVLSVHPCVNLQSRKHHARVQLGEFFYYDFFFSLVFSWQQN